MEGGDKGMQQEKQLKIPDGFFVASVLCTDEGCMDLHASQSIFQANLLGFINTAKTSPVHLA